MAENTPEVRGGTHSLWSFSKPYREHITIAYDLSDFLSSRQRREVGVRFPCVNITWSLQAPSLFGADNVAENAPEVRGGAPPFWSFSKTYREHITIAYDLSDFLSSRQRREVGVRRAVPASGLDWR